MDKKIWIIGSSSGIGLQLVKIMLNNNYKVIASSRNATSNKELNQLIDKYPENLHLINIDVSSEDSVKESTQNAFKLFHNINICFYNAGIYEITNIENLNISEFESMMNINFLGSVRVLKHFLKHKKDNYNSKLILNASISSYFGLPYGGAYSSTKAAMLNFAQSIQPELKNKNIDLQIINHGFVKTRLTNKNQFMMPQIISSKEAAQKIYESLHKPYKFEIYFPFIISNLLKLISLLPYKISFFITKKFLKSNSNF